MIKEIIKTVDSFAPATRPVRANPKSVVIEIPKIIPVVRRLLLVYELRAVLV